jgi:hypothetical protein
MDVPSDLSRVVKERDLNAMNRQLAAMAEDCNRFLNIINIYSIEENYAKGLDYKLAAEVMKEFKEREAAAIAASLETKAPPPSRNVTGAVSKKSKFKPKIV